MAQSEWQYTADNGTVYKTLADTFITGQQTAGAATVGGAAAAGTEPTLPSGWKKRKVELIHAGVIREVTAYHPTAPIFTAGAAVNLHLNHVSTAFTYNGHWRGETPPRRFHV